MESTTYRRFFRIVETKPARRFDFTSQHERGVEPRRPLSIRDRDRWRGVSHFQSFQAALTKAIDSPWLGEFVAEVELPPDGRVRVEQTGRDKAHFTIWADADDLLSWVISVRPADQVE